VDSNQSYSKPSGAAVISLAKIECASDFDMEIARYMLRLRRDQGPRNSFSYKETVQGFGIFVFTP
jgi:hypothetical protein